MLASLLVGSLPGIYIGSNLVGRVPDLALRAMLGVVLVLVGVRLLMY